VEEGPPLRAFIHFPPSASPLISSKRHAQGFWARPQKNADGSQNVKIWDVGIPGRENVRLVFLSLFPLLDVATKPRLILVVRSCTYRQTNWEGGVFPLTLHFPDGTFSDSCSSFTGLTKCAFGLSLTTSWLRRLPLEASQVQVPRQLLAPERCVFPLSFDKFFVLTSLAPL
jgi:hypothetical protein